MSVDKTEFSLWRWERLLGLLRRRDHQMRLFAIGIMVMAFSLLSLELPLVLIRIEKRARIHDRLLIGGRFAGEISLETRRMFLGRFASSEADQFRPYRSQGKRRGRATDRSHHRRCSNVPSVKQLPGGDHTIFVGLGRSHARGGLGKLLLGRSRRLRDLGLEARSLCRQRCSGLLENCCRRFHVW